MREKILKSIFATLAIMLVVTPAFVLALPMQTQAAVDENILWGGQKETINSNIGLGNKDPRAIAASIIKVALGFLGIIAVVIILLGGFKWMTAGGNEEGVEEAKKLIIAGVIGLVIILASWGIASFVISSLLTATS